MQMSLILKYLSLFLGFGKVNLNKIILIIVTICFVYWYYNYHYLDLQTLEASLINKSIKINELTLENSNLKEIKQKLLDEIKTKNFELNLSKQNIETIKQIKELDNAKEDDINLTVGTHNLNI